VIEGITFDRQVRSGISVRSSRDVRITSIRATETSALNIRDSINVAVRKAAVTSTFRSPALFARTSTDVTFSEVAAFGPSPWGRTDVGSGIVFESVSNGVVNHALVSGYKDGVLFQCSGCAPSEIRNSGAVLDSTFMDNQYGVDVNGAAKVRIAGNTMLRSVSYAPEWGLIGAGIMGGHFARVADLEVVDNSVSDSLNGIVFQDLTSSRIDGNVVTNAWQAGIVLGAGLLGTGSSGNTVRSNIVAGAPPDLWEQEPSAGNTWKDNTCRIASGEGVTCALVIP
jgi:parallel beta-helix repeat protein